MTDVKVRGDAFQGRHEQNLIVFLVETHDFVLCRYGVFEKVERIQAKMGGGEIQKIGKGDHRIIPNAAVRCFAVNNLVADVGMCSVKAFQHTAAQAKRCFVIRVLNGIDRALYRNGKIEGKGPKAIGVRPAGDLEQCVAVGCNFSLCVNNRIRPRLFWSRGHRGRRGCERRRYRLIGRRIGAFRRSAVTTVNRRLSRRM